MKRPERFTVKLGEDDHIVGKAEYTIQVHNYMDLICEQPQNYAYVASLYARFKAVTQCKKDELDQYEHSLRLCIISGQYTKTDEEGHTLYTTDTKNPAYDKKMGTVDSINSAIQSDETYCTILAELRKLERTRDLLQEAKNSYVAQKDMLQTFSSNLRDEHGYTNTYAQNIEHGRINKKPK